MRTLFAVSPKKLAASAALVAIAALGVGMSGAAPAGASTFNGFDAGCTANHQIVTQAMDLHAYPGWVAVWAPHLYRYNGYGWVSYQWGPTITSTSNDWYVQGYTFRNLPRGYYQTRMAIGWIYNGQRAGGNADQLLYHYLNGTVPYYTALYSTSSYCYEW
jgi:hypothetical protein